jgi:putative transposase
MAMHMKRKRYGEPQIAFALQQAEAGEPVREVCRKLGIADQTLYR